MPAVFTCDLRLNTPRFANVQNIIKAKKKPVETLNLADLGINIEPRLKVEKVEPPSERQGGVIVGSVDELVQKLKNEAKVIWKWTDKKSKCLLFGGNPAKRMNFSYLNIKS